MDTELIIVFTLCIVTILTVGLPLLFGYLKEKRESEERKIERKQEHEARRNREEDLCVLLGNLVKADAAMDYIGSRGGNSERQNAERMNVVKELLSERIVKDKASS